MTEKTETIYLNGNYVAKQEAKISVFDRGFLFADGVYEVIPVYSGQTLFLQEHLKRLQKNLDSIKINYQISSNEWQQICSSLIDYNGQDRPIYIQITRGCDITRLHDYNDDLIPTVVAFSLPAITLGSSLKAKDINIVTLQDNRAKLCNIKSIALLGNILLRKEAKNQGAYEALLINNDGYIVEGSSSNYFIVQNNKVITPPLNHEVLPGITRQIIIQICQENHIELQEKNITEQDLYQSNEVWITSSTREIVPVSKVNNQLINQGQIGPLWQKVSRLYIDHIKNSLNNRHSVDNI